MSTILRPVFPVGCPRVKAVLGGACATRKADFINNIRRYLAVDEYLLERTWAKGMTPAQHGEVLKIVLLAAKTNHLSCAMQGLVDPE